MTKRCNEGKGEDIHVRCVSPFFSVSKYFNYACITDWNKWVDHRATIQLVHFAILLQRIDRYVTCLRMEALCGACSAKAENTLWEMDEKDASVASLQK